MLYKMINNNSVSTGLILLTPTVATKITHRESFIKIQHIENSVYMKNVAENKFRKMSYQESLIKLKHIENLFTKIRHQQNKDKIDNIKNTKAGAVHREELQLE